MILNYIRRVLLRPTGLMLSSVVISKSNEVKLETKSPEVVNLLSTENSVANISKRLEQAFKPAGAECYKCYIDRKIITTHQEIEKHYALFQSKFQNEKCAQLQHLYGLRIATTIEDNELHCLQRNESGLDPVAFDVSQSIEDGLSMLDKIRDELLRCKR